MKQKQKIKEQQKKFYTDVVKLNRRRAKANINHKHYESWNHK